MSIKNVSVRLAWLAVLGVFVVFVFFVVPGGVPFTAPLRAEIIEQILVKVNGEIFTKTDLEQRQVLVLRQRGQQIDLKADPSNQQLRKALDDERLAQLLVAGI